MNVRVRPWRLLSQTRLFCRLVSGDSGGKRGLLPSEAEAPNVLEGTQCGVFRGDGWLWGLLLPFDTSLRKTGTEARDMPEAKGLRAPVRGDRDSGGGGRDLERLP